MGSVLSAAVAASLVLTVIRGDQEQVVADEVVSAHIRSLQAGHLMDVATSDQHTVKPWFNGRVDVAPPVIDLTAESFTLLGGRLDYVNSEPVAAIVYQRRKHVINLFVAQHLGTRHTRAVTESIQGYNVRHWSQNGLDFSQFNAEASQFDLVIHTPKKFQIPIRQAASAISRFIQASTTFLTKGVWHETFGSQLRPVEIATC